VSKVAVSIGWCSCKCLPSSVSEALALVVPGVLAGSWAGAGGMVPAVAVVVVVVVVVVAALVGASSPAEASGSFWSTAVLPKSVSYNAVLMTSALTLLGGHGGRGVRSGSGLGVGQSGTLGLSRMF
jgi:hypothetical protein